jgi:peptidyl-prolyl cis-trans isomerase C
MVKPDDSEEMVKAQLEKANEALARAKEGEDFTVLAKELSEEPGAAESGGDLGYFSKDRMVPEFSEAAFAMESGSVSEPVRTQFGWHIIKVEDKKDAGVAEFGEVKEQLGDYLEADKQRKAVEGLMESLREGAEIQNTLTPSN